MGLKNYYQIIRDIKYTKDILQNRPKQDTVDYKVLGVLENALDLIYDLRAQNAKLVALQYAMPEMTSENQNRIDIEKTFNQTYGVAGGICPTCNNWIQSIHSFCGFCGQPIGWRERLFDNGNNTGK